MSKTPKLRFKEFSGDWEEKKLGTLGQFLKGSTLSKADLSEEGKPCVLYGELYTKYNEVINNVISKTNLENDKLVLGQKNDVLIPSSGETAIDIATASCLQQDNVILGGDLNVFRSDKVNGVFTSYQLNSSKKREIARLSQGASVVHIYNDQLKKIKLSVPSKEEQEKIASFFSLIDYKISLQGEKVEALKDYKRGMMQKIFSRELRFKDDEGRDYPEWEDTELKEMIALTIDNRGKTPPTVQNGIPLLEVNSLGGIYPDFKQINKFVDEETYNEWFRNHIQEGDLLFTTVGATGLVSLANSTKSCIAQNIVGFRFKEGYTSKFMYNLFNYRETMKRIKAIEMGAVQPSIKVTQLIKLKFSIPSIDEQIKIGKILSSIDLKIEKEQEKLDSLNEYKKGLLQQMFV